MTTRAFDLANLVPTDPPAVNDVIVCSAVSPQLQTDWASASSSGGGSFPDAPSTGNGYGRQNAAWTPVLMLSGDTLDGGNF